MTSQNNPTTVKAATQTSAGRPVTPANGGVQQSGATSGQPNKPSQPATVTPPKDDVQDHATKPTKPATVTPVITPVAPVITPVAPVTNPVTPVTNPVTPVTNPAQPPAPPAQGGGNNGTTKPAAPVVKKPAAPAAPQYRQGVLDPTGRTLNNPGVTPNVGEVIVDYRYATVEKILNFKNATNNRHALEIRINPDILKTDSVEVIKAKLKAACDSVVSRHGDAVVFDLRSASPELEQRIKEAMFNSSGIGALDDMKKKGIPFKIQGMYSVRDNDFMHKVIYQNNSNGGFVDELSINGNGLAEVAADAVKNYAGGQKTLYVIEPANEQSMRAAEARFGRATISFGYNPAAGHESEVKTQNFVNNSTTILSDSINSSAGATAAIEKAKAQAQAVVAAAPAVAVSQPAAAPAAAARYVPLPKTGGSIGSV